MNVEILIVGGSLNASGVAIAPYSTITLLQDEGRNILIDPGSFVTHQILERKLKERNLSRLDITDILLTHFHLDHAYATRYFENATIYLHENYEGKSYEKFGDIVGKEYIDTMKSWKKVEKLKGGERLFGSVEVFHTPWHAREHVSYLVNSENMGVVFIPGDICFTRLDYYEMTKRYREGKGAEFCLDMSKKSDIIIFTHDEPLILNS